MSNYAELYWLTRLTSLTDVFSIITVLAGLAMFGLSLALFIMGWEMEDDERKSLKKYIRYSLIVFVTFGAMRVFTPTQNEAILILAGGKTLDFVESDTSISKIPSQTTAIVSEYLEKTLKELEEGSKEQ